MDMSRGVRWGLLTLMVLFVAACSGGGGGDDGGIEGTGFKEKLSGTAAVGKPLANTDVTVKDSKGRKKSAKTDANGKYEIDVSDLTGPFLLKVKADEKRELFAAAETHGVANLTPLSDVSCRNWFGTRQRDVHGEFESDQEIQNPPRENELSAIRNALRALLRLAYAQYGVNDSFDFDRTPFNADNQGFDGLLDNLSITFAKNKITILLRDPATGLQAVIIIGFDLSDDLAKPDTTAPTPPTGLAAIPSGSTGMVVVWNSSTDDIGVAGYNIYRDGTKIATSPYPVFSDTGLNASSQYCYRVEAFDGAGNTTVQTPPACATTLGTADTNAPLVPANLGAKEIGATSLALSWLPSPDDDVLGYDVYRGPAGAVNEKIATTIASGYTDIDLTGGTEYCYRVRSFDAALNRSDFSGEICATTPSANTSGDTTAPSSSATPAGGVFGSAQSVALICDDGAGSGCGAIYFTLDGSAPTTLSSVYSQPISIGTNTTLRFFAVDKAGNDEPAAHSESYVFTRTIGGTVIGLAGNGLVLTNNGGNALAINADGSFTFTNPVNSGSTYLVAVATQPSNRTQVCNVSNGSGTAGNVNVTTVAINCTTTGFTVSGSISGLAGSGLVLQNNGANDQSIQPGATTFGFTIPVLSGADYAVTILSQPGNPAQTCTVTAGSGTVTNANITSVVVTCTTNSVTTYSIGGTVSGLNGSVVLQNNGGDNLTITANGPFEFATRLVNNAAYNVTVLTQPSGQTCTPTNNASNVNAANVTTVTVACVNNPAPTLSLLVTLNPDSVRSGEGIVALIHASNTSNATINNITLRATYPTLGVNNGFSQTFITGGGTCPAGACDRGEAVDWTIGSLQPGQGTVVSLPMTVTGGTANGTQITVPATLSVNGNAVAADSATVTVQNSNALSLALSQNKNLVAPGAAVTYTLTYGNQSTGTITTPVITLPLPDNSTFVSATNGGAVVGNAVQWSLANGLAPSQSGRVQAVVQIGSGLADGTLLPIKAAQFTGTNSTGGAEIARASVATRVRTNAGIGLTVELNPDPVRSGEGLRTNLTVTNLSGVSQAGVQLNARFPTDRVNNTNPQTLITGGGTCPGGLCDRYEIVGWSLGNLAAGESTTVQLPIQVTGGSASGTLIPLDAIVSSNDLSPTTMSHAAVVDNSNSLSLALNEDRNVVAPGETLKYSLTFGNQSTGAISNPVITLPLPPNVTFVSATNGGTLSGNTVQWIFGSALAPGQSGRVQAVVTVNGGLNSGVILGIDAAEFSGTNSTNRPEVAHATAATRVQTTPGLGLAVEMTPDPVRAGEGIRTRLTVTNRSGLPQAGVALQARFPTDKVNNTLDQTLITEGGTCPGGFCDRFELVSWTLGDLAAGASTTVQLPMTVTGGTPSGTLITLDANVKANGLAPTMASRSVVVDNSNALSLALHEDNNIVAPNSALTYTLTYGNQSTGAVSSPVITLPLPADVTFVSATNGGVVVGDTVRWAFGSSLAAGQSGRVQATVTVNAGLDDGVVLAVDAAQINGISSTNRPESARATGATRVKTAPGLGLALEMDPDAIRSGEGIRTKLTVTNRSGLPQAGVALQARFPTDKVNNTLDQTLITGGGTCPGGFCDRYELVSWSLGDLPAGGSTTVQLPMQVTGGSPSGTLVTLDAAVKSNSQLPTLAAHSVVVDNVNALAIALYEDKDVVAPNATLTYTLTYGNQSTGSISNPVITLPLPANVTFTSASNGGTLVGNTVQWAFGSSLAAGQSGRVQAVVTVNNGVPNGTLLAVDAAQISGTNSINRLEYARGTAVSRVLAAPAIGLRVDTGTNRVAVNQTLTATITLTNNSGGTLSGAYLQARYPSDRVNNNLPQASLTGGGTCPNNACDRYELASWNLADIPAGGSVSVQMPMVITGGTPAGALIAVDAAATTPAGDQVTAGDTGAVGAGSF